MATLHDANAHHQRAKRQRTLAPNAAFTTGAQGQSQSFSFPCPLLSPCPLILASSRYQRVKESGRQSASARSALLRTAHGSLHPLPECPLRPFSLPLDRSDTLRKTDGSVCIPRLIPPPGERRVPLNTGDSVHQPWWCMACPGSSSVAWSLVSAVRPGHPCFHDHDPDNTVDLHQPTRQLILPPTPITPALLGSRMPF
jgi:hypothetical protein